MNYEELVCQMLADADESRSFDNFIQLARALGFGIAQISANAETLGGKNAILDNVFAAIRAEADEVFMQTTTVSPEEFLQHVYQPEKTND